MKKFGTNDTPFLAPNGDVTDGAPEELNRPTNQFFNNVYGSLKRFIEGAGLALTDANGTSPNLDLLKNASIAMRQNQTATALKTTGTSTAYAGSVTTAPTANVNDLRVFVEFHTASGANPTFNLNALGALPLKQIDIAGNKVAAVVFNGMKSDVVCDGTNWMVLDAAPPKSNHIGTTAGTAAAYTVTTLPTFDAATAQTRAQLIIHTGNAGVASTIDINGTGAKQFKQLDNTGALVNAVTFAGQIVDVVSNGTAWVMLDAVYQASDAGLIAFFASNSAPTGYLKANGAAISRASYATLFTAIGTTFGAGNGSTTFNLPDLRGEFIRGWDDGRGTDAARIFGSSQVSQNLSHDHGLKTEAGTPGYGELVFPDYPSSPWVERQLGNANDYAYAGFRVATFASGGNESRPRNIALLACIKY